MSKKKKRKLKLKNIGLMFVFLCIIAYGSISLINYLNPYKEEVFLNKGYSTSEVEFILSLDDIEKDKLIESGKVEYIIKQYTIEHYTELMNLGYLDDEITTILGYNNELITYITTHAKIENLNEWINQSNFIQARFDRYLAYYSENTTLTFKNIIERVNTNRDYAYYTNVQSTDTSLNELLLVNKYYQLDQSYVPDNLVSVSPYGSVRMVKVAAEAFIDLCDAAKDEGYTIIGISGYRSYSTQENLYNRYLKKDPQWLVDTYSARPGFSEHQSGLAIDVSSNNQDILTFEMSNSFKWMKDNAHLYGFILRYQKGKEDISGYKYEPWHYRYVGKEIAATLYSTGMTYDEYAALYLIN